MPHADRSSSPPSTAARGARWALVTVALAASLLAGVGPAAAEDKKPRLVVTYSQRP